MSYIFYPTMMQLFPALIYRINRCNQNDQRAIAIFLNNTAPPPQDGQPGLSLLVS